MSSGPESQQQPNGHPDWTAAMQEWSAKQAQYQATLNETSDPTEQLESQLGLETCQHVIQTCQELLRVMELPITTVTSPEQPLETAAVESSPSPSLPWPVEAMTPTLDSQIEPIAIETSPSSPAPAAVEVNTPSLSSTLASTFADSGTQRLDHRSRSPVSVSQPDVRHPPIAAPPASRLTSQPRSLSQRFWQVMVPLCLVALAAFAIFRPRNVCKIAPDGTYQPNGLVRWIQQVLQTDRRYISALETVSIAQTGCTIHLKGTVSSQLVLDDLIETAQNVEVPSQAMAARFIRQLQLGETQRVKPVQKVVIDLKIAPTRWQER